MMLPLQDPIMSAGMAGRMVTAAAVSLPHFDPDWAWPCAAPPAEDGQWAEKQARRFFVVPILHIDALDGPATEAQPISVEPGR